MSCNVGTSVLIVCVLSFLLGAGGGGLRTTTIWGDPLNLNKDTPIYASTCGMYRVVLRSANGKGVPFTIPLTYYMFSRIGGLQGRECGVRNVVQTESGRICSCLSVPFKTREPKKPLTSSDRFPFKSAGKIKQASRIGSTY